MKISEVMTRDVQTVRPDQTAPRGGVFHAQRGCRLDPGERGDRLIGMITDRDIAVRGVAKGCGPETPVRELMSRRHDLRARSTTTSRTSPRG